ncbi:hypothetical protein [Sutcliffiella sp. NC1]|uniref:hypothetical protein n=1 Tax=Sutcliffiella sp. NC1 TaxID=3004096 RepID=UPI0022DE2E22|nr:hypothetical protein [Sutcliffiella sp. NC1]WBL16374.1 hypothetical protein O1A01_07005 [Sutcliffiella sp. NC1]
MKLTKTLYTIHETEGELIGYDPLGRPVYSPPSIDYRAFKGELEPYSSKLAETTYGLIVQVTNRVFCYPNENILIGVKIRYNNEEYTVTECLRYDKHYEVLIRKGGSN